MHRLVSIQVLLVASGCSVEPARAFSPVPLPEPDGRPALRSPGPHSPRLASYRIDATLDWARKRLTATEVLAWKHDGVAPVNEIPLHLYMNAFKNESSVFLRESGGRHRRAEMAKDGWGWIEVTSVKDRRTGAELRPASRFGVDETVLTVPLAAPVEPGQTLELELAFTTQFPEVFARTGYKGDFLMAAQWFPKVGVLEKKGDGQAWHCEPFHSSSEFYADFGVYDVTLHVPDTHVIAATGVLMKSEAKGDGMRTLVYHAEDVHDFAWMADPHMKMKSVVADGDVEVRVYYRPEQEGFVDRHLEAGKRTIEVFGKYFVRYPWPLMSIIDPPPDAASGAGGMEYPMIVTTAADHAITSLPIFLPEQVTVHEVGHNWFQGILANNEVDEAWLDEGFNSYADGIVMDEWKGPGRSLMDVLGVRVAYYDAQRIRGSMTELSTPVATKSYEFPSFSEYGAATYGKTAIILKTMEEMVGREGFLRAFGAYTKKYAFKHPTHADFVRTMNEELGEDWSWFLDPAFHDVGATDLRVASIRTRKAHEPRGVFGRGEDRKKVGEKEAPDTGEWISETLLVSTGVVPVIVEVELGFDDGTFERRSWDTRTRFKKLTFQRKARLQQVTIDPDGKVLLEATPLDNSLRTYGSSRAAVRASARAAFWQQTLLQVVGL